MGKSYHESYTRVLTDRGDFPYAACHMTKQTETGKLLAEIEAFLGRTGMAASAVGHKVLNDGKLVQRLRDGRTVTIETAAKIRAFIAEYSDEDGADDDDTPPRPKKVSAEATA